jgi:purine-binding chemotaxis protein CheW
MECGILADAIGEVRSIPLDAIQPPLSTLTGIQESYVRGITAQGLVVLDVALILCDKAIIVNDEAWAARE